MAKKQANKPGVSENVMEMAAEHTDPAWWATMQLVKPGAERFKTVGEAHETIRRIFTQAFDMEMRRRGVYFCQDCEAVTKETDSLCSECLLRERTLDRMP